MGYFYNSENNTFKAKQVLAELLSNESVTILTSDIKIGKKWRGEVNQKNWKCHHYNKFNGLEDDVIIFYNTINLDSAYTLAFSRARKLLIIITEPEIIKRKTKQSASFLKMMNKAIEKQLITKIEAN